MSEREREEERDRDREEEKGEGGRERGGSLHAPAHTSKPPLPPPPRGRTFARALTESGTRRASVGREASPAAPPPRRPPGRTGAAPERSGRCGAEAGAGAGGWQ